jgi:hypothetical protein
MKQLFGLLVIVLTLGLGYWFSKKSAPVFSETKPLSDDAVQKRLLSKIKVLQKFLEKNPKYNNELVFLADLKIMSGKNRFFVYDLKQNKVTDQGLMAHGSGSETGIEGKLYFSNIPDSNTTSLGMYAIGKDYVGKFGKSYKLFGLEKTNDKAFERFIVLHHYEKVPYEEQGSPICNSLGCPMVNETFFNRLEKLIDISEKPILLYLYY